MKDVLFFVSQYTVKNDKYLTLSFSMNILCFCGKNF